MKLYGHEASGHAYKVALGLTLAQIPFEYQRVDIGKPCDTRPADFRAASKWCEVPCLFKDGQSHIQSGAILMMLSREYNVLGGVAKLNQAAEWINWEANRIGMCIPQLLGELNDGAREWLMTRYEIDKGRLDASLEDRKFLLGNDVSIADIAVYGYVSKTEKAGLNLTKNILNWRDNIGSLPHFQTADDLLA